jgi:flagellar motor switch/type III secretory pathway protein FliN
MTSDLTSGDTVSGDLAAAPLPEVPPLIDPVELESVPVEVCFEVARLRTSYRELAAARPGYTFELGCELSEQTIDITVGGALLARGELVVIGTELGVRISALARRHEPR